MRSAKYTHIHIMRICVFAY